MTVVLHLVTVDSLVINHILLLCKSLPTRITDPGLLSCVNPPVQLQLTFTDKSKEKNVSGILIQIARNIHNLLSQNSQTQGLTPVG